MTFIQHEVPFSHRDATFINALYCTPLGVLAQRDKDCLRRSLARAKLVCHWLDGILELMAELELKGK